MNALAQHACPGCGGAMARINGRSFGRALKSTRTTHGVPFLPTEWVAVCPTCDATKLGSQISHPWPFQCSDGVFRTVADNDLAGTKPDVQTPSFAGLQFSWAAMNSAVEILKSEDETTGDVEGLARSYLAHPNAADAYAFSEQACTWGRGQRVWANLNRHNGAIDLAEALHAWLSNVPAAPTPGQAIDAGLRIKGLSVSFASKHLRLLFPGRYGVLDEVISTGLGFALNRAGFVLFMRLLHEFQQQHASGLSMAQVESAIFYLVRQRVRSLPPVS